MPPRVPRSDKNLVQTLERELTLLTEYSSKAFRDGNQNYYGEVAGKLRLLVHEKGSNSPLLLALMDKYDINIPNIIDSPRGKYETNIRDYLDGMAFVIRTNQQGLVKVTNKDLIAIWAQQEGAAHIDWEIAEELGAALSLGINIGGIPATPRALMVISNTIIFVGNELLQILKHTV